MRTTDGVYFEELAPLPEPKSLPCLTIVDDQTLFLAGGFTDISATAEAYLYRYGSDVWELAGQMPGGAREALGCGVVTRSDGTKEVFR